MDAPTAWTAAAALAVLSAAAWLRTPSVRYLAACVLATAAMAVLAMRLRGRRPWPLGCVLATAVFCIVAANAQRELWRLEERWPQSSAQVGARSARLLEEELTQTLSELQASAAEALEAPATPAAAFEYLQPLARAVEERGIVLYRADQPFAWGGTTRVELDTLLAPVGIVFSPFYLTLYATAQRGDARAVATALVHAEPPADRLAMALDQRIADAVGGRGFDFFLPSGSTPPPGVRFAPAGRELLTAQPVPTTPGELRVRTIQRAQLHGGLALAAALACLLAVVWRRDRVLRWRLFGLAVALACVGIVPLNALSNATRLFDPAIYYVDVGGPFTASIGALALTSALLLLGLLALIGSRARLPSRALALGVVALIAGLAPFVLRALARGITPPGWGVSIGLWVAWEVGLFLAGVSFLLAGSSAGRAALGGHRGVSPLLAPAVAGLAATLAPLLWEAPGRWPAWYPVLWIVAVGALAFARRGRYALLAVAVVAALGSTTLVWGATARARVRLAQGDVAALGAVDPTTVTLLERFGEQLMAMGRPSSRAALLRRYVGSDLAAAELPVALGVWSPANQLIAELQTTRAELRPGELAGTIAAARAEAAPVVQEHPGISGMRLVLAVPYSDGMVATAVVEPRTRLVPDDPFALLLGVAPDPAGEPPYSLTLVPATAGAPELEGRRWEREGDELHGDWLLRTRDGLQRAHVEVELRALDVLVPRGALIILLNVAVLFLLWLLNALADGRFRRWMRARLRQWARSYRARLTGVLFLFFVVPALFFGAWAYRRLQLDERQSRELLVREALRSVASVEGVADLSAAAARLGTPLILFENGVFRRASDPLLDQLAPLGEFLEPRVHLALELGEEVTTSRVVDLGPAEVLFGYRTTMTPAGEVVLTAPAPRNELTVERRRRDLGVLVLFALSIGALAALWLSGVAARQFARPIGALRRAALAIAGGEREPPLGAAPPSEFVPVFAAFRHMAEDLDASRRALEDAQRRTAAILRNVASGVVAFGPDAVVALANPRADALLGVALPPGTPLSAIGSPMLSERVLAFLGGQAEEEDFDLASSDRQLHGRLTRLWRAGGAVLTLDDVTDLARAQRVLAWGEMARQVAHEIKNPLTPIRLGVQHLRRAHADRRPDFERILEQNVGRILDEIDRLDEIARAFSRYGTAPAEREPAEATDVSAVLRDVIELEQLGEGEVEWRLVGADDAAPAAARRDELREVLLNVLENARLAGARRVEARVLRDDGRVRIIVVDDGEGIPPEVLPRIFEPHFSTRTSGSGLGLAVSRRILEGWGGSIGVASERGGGTTVEIGLKAASRAPS